MKKLFIDFLTWLKKPNPDTTLVNWWKIKRVRDRQRAEKKRRAKTEQKIKSEEKHRIFIGQFVNTIYGILLGFGFSNVVSEILSNPRFGNTIGSVFISV